MYLYDVIIIGGGPAGLTAGIYVSRAGLKSLLLEKLIPGGQANLTDWIENYPGFSEGISGMALMKNIEQQARKFGLEIKTEEVTLLSKNKKTFILKTPQQEYETTAVIIASGARPERIGVPGESKLTGKGVSYCATCDGPLFRNREVLVVGGGDAAIEEALFLTRFANKVTVVHRRSELRASKILQDRAFASPKLTFIWDSVIEEIIGGDKVEGVKIKNVKSNEKITLSTSGVFVFIGSKPDAGFASGIVEMDKSGYINTNEEMLSSVEGICACGDVRKKILRQVVTACGEGAVAAVSASQHVERLKAEQK
jgi:thioredoxin reductase (NADPH)